MSAIKAAFDELYQNIMLLLKLVIFSSYLCYYTYMYCVNANSSSSSSHLLQIALVRESVQ